MVFPFVDDGADLFELRFDSGFVVVVEAVVWVLDPVAGADFEAQFVGAVEE